MSVPIALLVAAVAAPAAASADGNGRHHDRDYVYLDANPAAANTIAGFGRNADGSLTALPGSPFAAGGVGLGTGLGSQGAIQVADDGRYLLAVDAGSNQISVLRIGDDGSLAPVAGSPFASGGVEPNSIAVSHNLVYVENTGGTAPNYTGFWLGHSGRLTPIANSTVTVAAGSSAGLGDVLFDGDGTRLVGVEVGPTLGPSQIDSFRVNWNGTLTAAPGSPFPAQGLGPFGSVFSPINPNQLFVSNAHNGAGLGTVSAFNDSWNGTLSSIGASPFADDQTAPCWLAISHDGEFLYALNTASASVSSYSIGREGTLTLIGSSPISNPAGVVGTDISLSTDGNTLYLNEASTHTIAAFAVDGGTVTQLPGSPYSTPAGASTAGVVVAAAPTQ
ncbi:MAG: lactonase family protein [Solirubrobacteraceae bacterium]